jgi:hypothetical protein
MKLKTIILAGVTAASLAAPVAALAQPYGDHGRREDYRRDDGRRDEWRRGEYRAYDRWDGRYDRGYGRCFTENRGYYAWNGRYVSRPREVCH